MGRHRGCSARDEPGELIRDGTSDASWLNTGSRQPAANSAHNEVRSPPRAGCAIQTLTAGTGWPNIYDRLPTLMIEARGRHPIRALIATHHEAGDEPLWQRLDTRIRANSSAVSHLTLPEVKPVIWDDIELYIGTRHQDMPARVKERLQRTFERVNQETVTFLDLAHRLNRYLH